MLFNNKLNYFPNIRKIRQKMGNHHCTIQYKYFLMQFLDADDEFSEAVIINRSIFTIWCDNFAKTPNFCRNNFTQYYSRFRDSPSIG